VGAAEKPVKAEKLQDIPDITKKEKESKVKLPKKMNGYTLTPSITSRYFKREDTI